MAGKFESYIVGWAQGTGANLATSRNKKQSWASLKAKLSKPHATPETRREFDKMSKDQQDALKAAAGWISGATIKGNHRSLRNVLPRDLLTIDIDYCPEYFPDLITDGLLKVSHFEAFWHSSRRHTKKEPRVRMFAPLARTVDVDEYQALVRYVAWLIDSEMKTVDKVSFRPAQMMFMPTVSADDIPNFFKFEQFGVMIDPDALLGDFVKRFGDWRDWKNWPRHDEERDFRKRAERAEDPRAKSGPVGVFCRAYTIEEAMREFIPDVYIPGDEHSGNPRYTYFNSTSSNGAVVYDDGLFLYSHHGHDPLCDMNVNAFDMVRIHLFGEEDARAKADTSPTRMPSFKAMVERIRTDDRYRAQLKEDKLGDIGNAFTDIEEESDDSAAQDDEDDDFEDLVGSGPRAEENDDDEEDFEDLVGSGPKTDAKRTSSPDKPKPSTEQKPNRNFLEDLELSENDEIKSNLPNVAMIVANDPRTVNVIRFNEFTKQIVFKKDLKPNVPAMRRKLECTDTTNGTRWEDYHDFTVRAILETENGRGVGGYGLKVAERDLQGGLDMAARGNPFHPIRDYLLGLQWDGVRRVDTMLIDYLGVPDTPYHREVSRLMLVASVTRVFHPGHKFDFACIIEGPQGIRKSSFVKTLYSEEWFGEIRCDLGDQQKIAEAMAGIWGGELPELSALGKSDFNAAKAFMRATKDDVRMVYMRRVQEFPRQAVFWGTTNEAVYLRDPTGNRSWWPVTATVESIDTDKLEAERDQLWAEAFEIYWSMRCERPKGTLPLFLTPAATLEATAKQNAARNEEVFESWYRHIMDWLDTPITLRQFREEIGAPQAMSFDGPDDSIMVLRCAFTEDMAMELALRKPGGIINDQAGKLNLNKLRPMLDKAGWMGGIEKGGLTARNLVSGVRARWRFRPGISYNDKSLGYQIVKPDDDDDDDDDPMNFV